MAFVNFPLNPTVGQIYILPSSGVSYRWDGEKWTTLGIAGINIGPSGPPGPPGPPSIVPGPPGATGATGPASGVGGGGDGATGATGPSGLPGATGASGPSGPSGATGPASTVPGPSGATGPQGPPGPPSTGGGGDGATGATGPSGLSGPPGATGASGPSGPPSTVAGPTGATGPAGPVGLEFVNIKNFGAVGNGITNDSAAFASALAASAGRAIYFPKGSYNLQSMAPATGICNLVGSRDAVIKGFNYTDLNAPNQVSFNSKSTDAHFTATGLIFEGTATIPGLTIKNQSQPSVIRSGDVIDCSFYNGIGLVLDNCQGCRISKCDFFNNIYGIRNLSSTNNVFTDCNFYKPIVGVELTASTNDTTGRLGGENAKFIGCMWIDGVTAINSINHNYLWLSSCLIDYFNSGIYLAGSKFTKIDGCYIGVSGTDKSFLPNYRAPLAVGALYVTGVQATSRSSGVHAINSEFLSYFNIAQPSVRLIGNGFSGFSGCEECFFTNSRFSSMDGASNTMQYLFYANFPLDLYMVGNIFHAPNNRTIVSPWIIVNQDSSRTTISNNFTTNVF